MAWKQIVPFNLSKMGTQPGMCLKNVRLAYGIAPMYADAKAAMLANKNAGTLHDISTLPTNVAVPVFVDTSSKYEHVEVADCGTFYSDGKKLTNPMSQKFFGWGETLNGVRIVEYVDDPKPTLKYKVGDVVDINGVYTSSNSDQKLSPAITTGTITKIIETAKNPYLLDDGNLGWVNDSCIISSASTDFKVGDKVTLINYVDYSGTPLRKTRDYYYISQLSGDRATLRADNPTSGAVYAAVNTANLRLV